MGKEKKENSSKISRRNPNGEAVWSSDLELMIDKQSTKIAQLFNGYLSQVALWI